MAIDAYTNVGFDLERIYRHELQNKTTGLTCRSFGSRRKDVYDSRRRTASPTCRLSEAVCSGNGLDFMRVITVKLTPFSRAVSFVVDTPPPPHTHRSFRASHARRPFTCQHRVHCSEQFAPMTMGQLSARIRIYSSNLGPSGAPLRRFTLF